MNSFRLAAVFRSSYLLIVVSVITVVPALGADRQVAALPLFDPSPAHSWNRLHSHIWLRQDRDGRVFGAGRLDPLLWSHTRFLTAGESARQLDERLDAFLRDATKVRQDPLKRAIMQRDLWSVFDWLANRENEEQELDRSPAARAVRRVMLAKLARALRHLALPRAEIKKLRGNYPDAVSSKAFPAEYDAKAAQPFLPPRLLDKEGPWVGLGTSDGPVAPGHVRGAFGLSRSAFTVYLNLPEGRQRTLQYIKRLAKFPRPFVPESDKPGARLTTNPATPSFPVGTQVALLRRMLLIDDQGKIAPTQIVEQLQFRVYRQLKEIVPSRKATSYPPQFSAEFVLDRARLFTGKSGGLRAVAADEQDFGTIAFSHGIDPFEGDPARTFTAARHRGPVLKQCAGCHREAGVLSFNTYTRIFGPRFLHPPKFFATDTRRADQMNVLFKHKRYDWGLLTGLWRHQAPSR